MVNHSVSFIGEDGLHTNNIEGTWSGIKQTVPARNNVKGRLKDKLFEFMWRRKNRSELWDAFLRALR